MQDLWNPCVIIPVYNHEHAIENVVLGVLNHHLPIVLVNDGSSPECVKVLVELADKHADCVLVSLPENRGKGGAVKAGIREAWMRGYSHALQVDADGQHNLNDLPSFLAVAQKSPSIIVSGCPVYDETVPTVRFYARYLTHIWVIINSLSLQIKDSMCGLRVYPLAAVCRLIDEEFLGNRMDFDPELLVRWVWRGGEVTNIETHVRYPADGVSHFQLFQDNVLITKMHTRLFFGMLARLPRLIWRKISTTAT
ncbi:glycosyltransferase family 2 protein [Aurantivibrio plasticivorans]